MMTQKKFLTKCRNAGIAVRETWHDCHVHVTGQTDEYAVEQIAGDCVVRFKRKGSYNTVIIDSVEAAQRVIENMLRRPLS